MTTQGEEAFRKLERALVETYRLTDEQIRDVDVVHRTMQTIRRSSMESDNLATVTMLDQLVWRTATITAAVVLIATMLMVGVLHKSPLDQAGLLAEEFESTPLFGE